MTHPWQSPERQAVRDTVKEKLGKGWTYTEIGELVGISRSAVAGIASRIGAKAPPKVKKCKPPPKPKVIKPRRAAVATIAPVAAPIVIPKPTGAGVYLLDVGYNHCRYLTGEWMFCGEPKSYRCFCAYHAQLCYVPDGRRAKPATLPPSLADKAFRGAAV